MSSDSTRRSSFLTVDRQILLVVFGAAVLGRLFALQAWWCLDDWGQLARAAGYLDPPAGFPARILGQHWWWSLVWPVLGLSAVAHAALRMVLHGLAAVAVSRIVQRFGISPTGSLVAGLVFGASPVAFTVLFWASGIQELLAGLLALWAVERWLARGAGSLVAAALLGGLSMLAKESGLGLPVLLLASWFFVDGQRLLRLAVILFLLLVAGGEAWLVAHHFAMGEGEPYQTGGALTLLRNLGQFGVWLALPLPVFPPRLPWPHACAGFLLWSIWAFWAWRSWSRGQKFPAAALFGALLSLGPALPLTQQVRPYMAYTAVAALAIVLGGLILPAWRWPERRTLWLGAASLAVAFSLLAMKLRLRTGDPVVRATNLARESIVQIKRGLPAEAAVFDRELVIFQQPMRPETVKRADQLGPTAVRSSPRYVALGKASLGLTLMLPEAKEIHWLNSIVEVPARSFVFCEAGSNLEAWGNCGEALLYAAMFDVSVANNDRSARELLRADQLKVDARAFAFDPDLFPLSPREFRHDVGRFRIWLEKSEGARTYTPRQKAAMHALLEDLVQVVTEAG